MLHVLDGDATRAAFDAARIEGDVVVWGEACMEGPWPRALRGLDDALARIRRAEAEGDEIVAWFDTDLFCRLNAACALSHAPRATWTNVVGTHLRRQEMRALFGVRAPMSPRLADVWRAYVGPDPRALLPFVDEFPWVKLHLSRFPSVKNGLDIVEERFLRQLRHDGPSGTGAIAARMRLGSTFAPDQWGLTIEAAKRCVDELGALIERGQPHLQDHPHVEDWRAMIAISERGRAVLEGERDRCDVVPLDRWVGGVHLEGHEPAWRWDGSTLLHKP
ncbi:MAG TPA: hypothetical protein VM370_03835 [Candidatus Thermoplasmatota archaeon]|nr:hypothetical protein [Candidatus Thermoplasmatota archaeon]